MAMNDTRVHLVLSSLRAELAEQLRLVSVQAQLKKGQKGKLSAARSMVAAIKISDDLMTNANKSVNAWLRKPLAKKHKSFVFRIPTWAKDIRDASVRATKYEGDREDHPDVVNAAQVLGRVVMEMHAMLGTTEVADA
jgi:hypothetical protein